MAVLKLYFDPRLTDEPICLEQFNLLNESEVLVAPRIYKYKIISPNQGWFIMELLPEAGSFFKAPLVGQDRDEFLKVYITYRENFPEKPFRNLYLLEKLPANEFYLFRINYWLRLAVEKEQKSISKGEEPVLDHNKFLPLYTKALDVIRQEFKNRKMFWCHGHFKPQEIYKVNESKYY